MARRAAEGMTNRTNAQTLFLTEKTIEMHLSRACRKLGISSRTSLPETLGATA